MRFQKLQLILIVLLLHYKERISSHTNTVCLWYTMSTKRVPADQANWRYLNFQGYIWSTALWHIPKQTNSTVHWSIYTPVFCPEVQWLALLLCTLKVSILNLCNVYAVISRYQYLVKNSINIKILYTKLKLLDL